MTIAGMREALINRYPNSNRWRIRVQNMQSNQVYAIYHSMIIERKPKHIEKPKKNDPVQLTIWDILNEGEKANHERNGSDP